MREVSATTHYGQSVILDQCPECGGIWFDTHELYMPKQGQAAVIEKLKAAALQARSVLKNPIRQCPRDQEQLARFKDPFFPADLVIERCALCGGLWLNRGEFIKYQDFRRTRLERQPESSEGVIAITPETKKQAAVQNLGRFLSTPMDPLTWKPLEPEKMSEKERTALNTVLSVVNLLLRYLVRF